MFFRHSSVIVVLAFILVGFNSTAQIFETDNSVDAKYTPPENSVFHVGKKISKKNGSSSMTLDGSNLIKWNMSSIARGNVAFEYERGFLDQLSVMGSVGITVFPDYIQQVRNALNDEFSSTDIQLNGPSWFLGAEAKLFFDYFFESDYIGLGYRQFNYNLSYPIQPGSSNLLPLDFTQNNRDLYITYGIMTYLNDRLVGEFSMAVGIRKIRSQSLASRELLSGGSFNTEYFLEPDRRNVFTFFMSYKLGIAFGD